MNEFLDKINALSSQIEHLLNNPEQITLESVQKMNLPPVQVNRDLVSKLTEYSNKRIGDKNENR